MNGLWADRESSAKASSQSLLFFKAWPNPPCDFRKVSALRSALNRGDASQLAEAIGAARRWGGCGFWSCKAGDFGWRVRFFTHQMGLELEHRFSSFSCRCGVKGQELEQAEMDLRQLREREVANFQWFVCSFCVSIMWAGPMFEISPSVKTERNLCRICRSQLSDLTPVQESTIFLPFSAAGPVSKHGGGEKRVAAACRHCAERESRRAVAALHGGGRTAELRSGPQGEICCVAYRGMHSKGLVIHISDILPDPGRTAETWGLGKASWQVLC